MIEIIDLSQDIYPGMDVFSGHPAVIITPHIFHKGTENSTGGTSPLPAVNRLEMGEHTGTHVDAFNHMAPQFHDQSIDRHAIDDVLYRGHLPGLVTQRLDGFDRSSRPRGLLSKAGLEIKPGDTVLLHTDHYRRTYGTKDWENGPGISAEAARWLGSQRIAAFGVETMSPGVRHVSNREVHVICGEMGFTHYENLINLHQLVGRGRFRFIGLPLKIRGGTGSPVRAIAVLKDSRL